MFSSRQVCHLLVEMENCEFVELDDGFLLKKGGGGWWGFQAS